MICTFFGHGNTPSRIEGKLRETIASLIDEGVEKFYVGDKGNFDFMVRRVLKELKGEYPNIKYSVVLAYLPKEKDEYENHEKTIYPEGLENTPLKFAIDRRNRWMLERSGIVVSYVETVVGGAAKFTELAKRQGKRVINIAE